MRLAEPGVNQPNSDPLVGVPRWRRLEATRLDNCNGSDGVVDSPLSARAAKECPSLTAARERHYPTLAGRLACSEALRRAAALPIASANVSNEQGFGNTSSRPRLRGPVSTRRMPGGRDTRPRPRKAKPARGEPRRRTGAAAAALANWPPPRTRRLFRRRGVRRGRSSLGSAEPGSRPIPRSHPGDRGASGGTCRSPSQPVGRGRASR